jgi:amino acid adenylation domain-containing protein
MRHALDIFSSGCLRDLTSLPRSSNYFPEQIDALPRRLMDEALTSVMASQPVTDKYHQPITSGNYSSSKGCEETYVPDLVAAQALASPNAPAVMQGTLRLSYQQLDDRASHLAHLLRSLGVGPDVVVAVYLNRSPAMIVAALGILKAGGAYLPLDPSYPAERLAFMLKDSRAEVLVTGQCMVGTITHRLNYIITMDPEGRLAAENLPQPVARTATSGPDLAYVIYTSGSTGKPKGVEVTHGNLLNLVRWHQKAFAIGPADRASQLSALGFDAAVWEIWPYLVAGASIHLPCNLATHDPVAVRDWLVSQEITIGFLPTPLAEQAMVLDWPRSSALRVMLTGADTLHHYPPRSLRFQLVNNYGPTECAVVATSGLVSPSEHPDRLPTIGLEIENAQIHILDDELREVSAGEPGEIYIGGEGVARGYRNQPELTRQKFLPNPFSHMPGARLYKTGDLARRLPDGQIAFLGRVDEQIKIRGFRIEPGEIVKILDEHPDVRASVVVAREIAPGDRRLVAYFVRTGKTQPSPGDLRNFLAARLPQYMVPATFVQLDILPLNASGKIDRAALPEPTLDNTLRDKAFAPPQTPVEQRLAEMLTPLLGLDQVSMEDNFFMLGGHSLLGTQLISRVRDGFGVELTLRSLFEAPTISRLAAQIENMLMAKLEAMSDAEAERLLEATGSDIA